jgi:hypothetical protein
MIKLKRACENPSRDDGLRILVKRLWPRGLTRGSQGDEEAKRTVYGCYCSPTVCGKTGLLAGAVEDGLRRPVAKHGLRNNARCARGTFTTWALHHSGRSTRLPARSFEPDQKARGLTGLPWRMRITFMATVEKDARDTCLTRLELSEEQPSEEQPRAGKSSQEEQPSDTLYNSYP